MQKIKAPHRNNYLARAGNYQKCETVSEFGVFGTYISDGSNEYRNNNEGYLVRTKTADSNEGGVAAGFAVVDSLYLY